MIFNNENPSESGSADGDASSGSIAKRVAAGALNTRRLDQRDDGLFAAAPDPVGSSRLDVSFTSMLRHVWLILGVFVLILLYARVTWLEWIASLSW